MRFGYIIVALLVIAILWSFGRFIFTRITLLRELKYCKRKGVITDYHFNEPLSLFSGIKGETSDLQLTIGNKIVIIKLIGGIIRRKLKYEISDYNVWNIYHFLPFAIPFLIDPIGIKKVFHCKFDLEKERFILQSEPHNKINEVEIAYLFSPTPLSVKEISHKKEQEMCGGDMCHGARILTKKTLRNTYEL